MKSEPSPQQVDGDGFLSVTALAKLHEVSKQAISKKIKALGSRITTRREGRTLLVHAATFAALKADEHPAQALRNGTPPPAPPAIAATSSADRQANDDSYQEAIRRKAAAEAEKVETANALRRGELIESATLAAAAMTVATRVSAVVGALRGRSQTLFAAAQAGEDAFHVALTEAVDAAITDISSAMRELAERA